jgi:uncharacterized protein (TIGR02996 family)
MPWIKEQGSGDYGVTQGLFLIKGRNMCESLLGSASADDPLGQAAYADYLEENGRYEDAAIIRGGKTFGVRWALSQSTWNGGYGGAGNKTWDGSYGSHGGTGGCGGGIFGGCGTYGGHGDSGGCGDGNYGGFGGDGGFGGVGGQRRLRRPRRLRWPRRSRRLRRRLNRPFSPEKDKYVQNILTQACADDPLGQAAYADYLEENGRQEDAALVRRGRGMLDARWALSQCMLSPQGGGYGGCGGHGGYGEYAAYGGGGGFGGYHGGGGGHVGFGGCGVNDDD